MTLSENRKSISDKAAVEVWQGLVTETETGKKIKNYKIGLQIQYEKTKGR